MPMVYRVLLYAFASGFPVFIGGGISCYVESSSLSTQKRDLIIHLLTAFAGGILVAAVSFVLAPRGNEQLGTVSILLLFTSGSLCFFLLDRAIESRGGKAAQIMAMLMDYLPEALSLGAVFAHDIRLGLLLAVFIGLQNLPESFGSYIDLRASGMTTGQTLSILFALSFSGPAAALAGYTFLRDSPQAIAGIMVFSCGGLLYLIFQDIAPLSKQDKSWVPALGACAGFLVGMIGEKLLG